MCARLRVCAHVKGEHRSLLYFPGLGALSKLPVESDGTASSAFYLPKEISLITGMLVQGAFELLAQQNPRATSRMLEGMARRIAAASSARGRR